MRTLRESLKAVAGAPTRIGRSARWFKGWLTSHRTTLEDAGKLIGILSALTAAIQYVAETSDRRLERLYKAWEVVGRASKDSVNGARNAALEDLASHGFPLGGIELTGARLAGAALTGVDLRRARLQRVTLEGASLGRAQLGESHLDSARMSAADLRRANLSGASLVRTDLRRANLTAALLIGANLHRAVLVEADLRGAYAFQADFREAQLRGARMDGMDLTRADLRGASFSARESLRGVASLHRANLAGISGLPVSVRRWAIDSMGAVELPSDSAWDEVRYGVDSANAPVKSAVFNAKMFAAIGWLGTLRR